MELSAKSTNKRVVPDGNIVIKATGASRIMVVKPGKYAVGVSRITLEVVDQDGAKATRSFTVTVKK